MECSGFDSRRACKAVPLRGTETLYLLALHCLAVHTRIELVSCDRQSRIIAIILMHLILVERGRFELPKDRAGGFTIRCNRPDYANAPKLDAGAGFEHRDLERMKLARTPDSSTLQLFQLHTHGSDSPLN